MDGKKRELDVKEIIRLGQENINSGNTLIGIYHKLLLAPSLQTAMTIPQGYPSIEYPHRALPSTSRASSSRTATSRNPRDLDRLFLCDDGTFQSIMKVSRRQLDRIFCELQQIGSNPPVKVIGLFSLLYYLTDSQSSFHQLADMIDVELNVIEDLVDDTARAVVFNLQEFAGIQWPHDLSAVMEGFSEKSSFVRIGGVLGHEVLHVNHGPSIMLQIVVDHNGIIRHFKVDCTTDPVDLLESSSLYEILAGTNEQWKVLCDASYPRLANLLPPYSGDKRNAAKSYNQMHLQTRQVLVEAFENLFDCFPKLRRMEKPSMAIVGAALVFYNVIHED